LTKIYLLKNKFYPRIQVILLLVIFHKSLLCFPNFVVWKLEYLGL